MTWKIITKPGCPHCTTAKTLLDARGLTYEVDNRDTPDGIDRFIAEGHRTFPRVFLDGELIGGADNLRDYLANQVEEDF